MMAVIALAGAGCLGTAGRPNATSARHGTISGTLRMIGGPAPGRRVLRHTGIRVYAGTSSVASTTTDAQGRFQLALAPGRYRLTLSDGSQLLPKHVAVAANASTWIHLTLSVK